ncbi:hypothetical protein SLE2022_071280 [Rubroshorea leprosula]
MWFDCGICKFDHRHVADLHATTPLPKGAKFVLFTLPVRARDVADGDGMTVYVKIVDADNEDGLRGSKSIPLNVKQAVYQRKMERERKNYTKADELHRLIIRSGYRIITLDNGKEIITKICRIRLRGIDAPELGMEYGNEAKEELVKLVEGRCLRLLVYGQDEYRRFVCDVYCNDTFVQEEMLRKGFAWHYEAYDQRLEFANWQKEARSKRRGLWKSTKPKKPWEWRRRNPMQR